MSCPKKEVELILWCRNWVTVYKRERFFSDGTYDTASDEYSDWLWALWWNPWECQSSVLQKDPEIVCMTNDGGETIVKWVVIFSYDWITRTSTVNNLDGSLATGYTVIPCATSNRVEEWEVRCDGGVNIVPFYDVETDWVASANVAFWFNPVTNSVVIPSGNQTPWACAVSKIVQVPNCAWTLDDKSVDSITATYLLNQENKHTEVISDVLTAVFWWTVAFTYTAPTNVAISYAGVTLANDTIVWHRTDFGDGYSDVGPSPDHSYNSDGAYEIKWYWITASGNKVLLYAKEVTIVWGVITYSGTNPHTVARTYKVLVAKAFQDYCGSTLVGSPYDADGGAYTLVWDFEVAAPIIIDELEDNAEYNPSSPCKDVIFATHDRVYVETITGSNVTLESWTLLLWAVFGGWANATNVYFFWNQWPRWEVDAPAGILLNDVNAMQNYIDNILIPAYTGTSIWDIVRQVNADNSVTVGINPATVNTTLFNWLLWQNPVSADVKVDLAQPAEFPIQINWGVTTYKCTPIQEIKMENSCTWLLTYKYIIEDGAWLLVDASTVIAWFDEANISDSCPVVKELWFESGCVKRTIPTTTIIRNRRSDSYWYFTAQQKDWIDEWYYDSTYAGFAPVWAPRNHYYEVKVFDASNTLVSSAVLWPYAVDITNSTYLQFLTDIWTLTSSLWVAFVWTTPAVVRAGYQIEYNNTIWFGITFRHWVDNHAGGIQRNPDIKQAIKYDTSYGIVRDSIQTTWDLNNVWLDAWWREWTTGRWVIDNNNVTVI